MARKSIADLEAVLAESERRSGPDHPATLKARVLLALAYRERDRDEEAVAELRRVVTLREGTLGAGHPDTLAARHELALSCFHVSVGNDNPAWLSDAVATMELTADGRLSALGPAHPHTLASWESLAILHSRAGRRDDRGRDLRERIAAGWEQVVAGRRAGCEPAALDVESFPGCPPGPVARPLAACRASAWRRAKMASLILRLRDRSASLCVFPSASFLS